jgi:putative ABC transport system permease protein
MFPMFFKTALRNFRRNFAFSFLNLIGLSVGLTVCILISLFVLDEYQFDKNIPDGERIYRLYVNRVTENDNEQVAMVPPVFVPTLIASYPEVENATRFMKLNDKALIEYREKNMYQEGGIIADSSFFHIFPLPVIFGSVEEALNQRGRLVISQELSFKMFGSDDPVGKILVVNKDSFEVRAVFRNDPRFHLNIGYMLPMQELTATIPEERMRSWGWMQFNSYVKVKPGADVNALERKFQVLAKKEGTAFSVGESYKITPFFQQLKNVHLYSRDFKYDMAKRGNILYVRTLTIIAIFILLIACFNFINLSTARSLKRAREVGVRKTLGADRGQLMVQFIGETVLLTLLAIIVSVILVFIFLPTLNSFTDKSMHLHLFSDPFVPFLLLLFGFLVGIFAGFYPSLVLSGFEAVKVLKGQVFLKNGGGTGHLLRKGLVVVQFTISIVLIISAVIVYNQVNFLHSKDLGFNKENILFFQMRGDDMFSNSETFKNELLKLPAVSNVSIGYGFPGDQTAGDQIIVQSGGERTKMPCTQLMVDHDYVKTLGLQMVAGRDFSRSVTTDPNHAFIINETAVREMGFGTPEKAIGQTLFWPMWIDGKDTLKEGRVIGVVKDFHFKSLYDRLESTVIQIFPGAYWKVAVKFNAADVGNMLNGVETVWNKFSPSHPFEYRFLDDSFSTMYRSEDKLRSLLWVFTCMAIFVGCLGLFGLASFAAEKRRKEIGIRKVLGAGIRGLVILLTREFVQLVLIAMVIASPIAFWAMSEWLQDFPYRISISFWIFISAGLVTIFISLLTVGFQALKAAFVNPVNSLRAE